jgi:hypothetical protein
MAYDAAIRTPRQVCPNHVLVFSELSVMRPLSQFSATLSYVASTNWAAAYRIYYIPFYLPAPFSVRKLLWMVGSSAAGAPNIIMSVYDQLGNKLCTTGAVVCGAATTYQGAAPTVDGYTLPAGRYYWAVSLSGTANCRLDTISLVTNPTQWVQMTGVLKESADPGAHTHPDVATFAASGLTAIPIVGMQEDTSLTY